MKQLFILIGFVCLIAMSLPTCAPAPEPEPEPAPEPAPEPEIDPEPELTPADEDNHIDKHQFKVPFVCGARDLGEALRRINEGAAMMRTKGEAGTGDIVEAVAQGKFHVHAVERIERVLETEGVTKEDIEAQRTKMRLFEDLLRTEEGKLESFIGRQNY